MYYTFNPQRGKINLSRPASNERRINKALDSEQPVLIDTMERSTNAIDTYIHFVPLNNERAALFIFPSESSSAASKWVQTRLNSDTLEGHAKIRRNPATVAMSAILPMHFGCTLTHLQHSTFERRRQDDGGSQGPAQWTKSTKSSVISRVTGELGEFESNAAPLCNLNLQPESRICPSQRESKFELRSVN